ncbi:TPA: DJ-1/PfpI family protein [Burkholderia aenigmatica]|uniref:DJ-1/PfpI family protein n=1 Tax=Burkholderia sp. AU45251 TaxID=3059204 RepID=UPI00265441F7|nr:DJ-1/PfpI family protein [Burkholderia sp. AU45251]HDR9482650.1 DJ-1/PfpI family protein [Burkholderia aenigmatica]MDN7517809.1 DJ-1/PfpI family protein [Burkholderia sp. AU45251]HDR9513597.1 DJ-1/PfpI family protein [Burkholderia aenigmatica]HDR9590988.1 DJ-1/PfpI family protein [Burkholderia aenigmatica]HDR9601776.1 DJ-1/PfpI family protein [Burkholderia aenigmatica]
MESALKDIALVAFDRFTDVDLFLMWDILGRNNRDWRVRILGAQPVLHSAHGLAIPTHGPLADANHADAVLFSSGKEGVPAALAHPDFLPSFDLDPERQLVGSICGGAFILERLGLLPERRATTHPDARMGLQALGLDVLNQPLVCHGNVATAGGCLASVYLTGWLVESMFDADKRRETLLPVLPAGQREIYEDLIEFSVRQGAGQTTGPIRMVEGENSLAA